MIKNILGKIYAMFYIVALVAVFYGCSPKTPDVLHVTKLEATNVKNGKLELNELESFRVKLDIEPAELDTVNIEWNSSNPKVATVKNGRIEALYEGKATITAIADGVELSIDLRVNQVEITSFSSAEDPVRVVVNDNIKFPLVLEPSNANPARITYVVEDESIAKIVDGKLYGLKKGTTSVTLKKNNSDIIIKIISINVVENIPLESFSIPTSSSMECGGMKKFIPTKVPSNSTSIITWTSSNPSIATVNKETGLISAVAKGTTIITATSDNGIEQSCEITVKPATAQYVTISPSSVSLPSIGSTKQLTTTILPEITEDKSITWSSSNSSIVSVSSTGLVKAVNYGSATVTATTSNGVKASITISVGIPVTKITVAGTKTYNTTQQHITISGSKTLSVTLSPSNATLNDVEFSVAPINSTATEACVSVNSSGVLTPKSIGDGILTIKSKVDPSVSTRIYVHYVTTQKSTAISSVYCNNKYVGYVFASNKAVLLYEVLTTPKTNGSIFQPLWYEIKSNPLDKIVEEGEVGSRTDGLGNTKRLNEVYGSYFAKVCIERGGWLPAIEEIKSVYKARQSTVNNFPAMPDNAKDNLETDRLVSSTYDGGLIYTWSAYMYKGEENRIRFTDYYTIWTLINPSK